MSSECCTFCETLPGAPVGWGDKASKCPLCKQELWVTQDGTTHRLGGAVRSARWRWVAGLGALAIVCTTVGVITYRSQSRDLETPPPERIEVAVKARQPAEPVVPEPAGPTVQAKRGVQAPGGRVKPLLAAVVKPAETQVAAASIPASPMPVAKARGSAAPFETPSLSYGAELEKQLLLIPEVDLDPDYLKKSKDQIAERAKEIIVENKDAKDAFVRNLIKKRDDLAGLPFLLGKDCELPKEQARALAHHSLVLRTTMAAAEASYARTPRVTSSQHSGAVDHTIADALWREHKKLSKKLGWNDAVSLPAFRQILPVENQGIRLRLVDHFGEIKDAKATEALVHQAIYDLEPAVRQAAVHMLAARPVEEYRASLKKAMRYPWAPVVRHAAEAIAVLETKDLIPDLVAMLDEPDPSASFKMKAEDGKERVVVRELVRINHHRNCMLCHAPIEAQTNEDFRALRDLPLGPSPSAQEPLPPRSSTIYYAPRKGVTLVRADVTYLRQDFSLIQEVKDPGKWSAQQRFDFLVRTRELTPQEMGQQQPVNADAYRHTLALALHRLTGLQAPPTAQAWRAKLAEARPEAKAKGSR